MRFYGLRDGLRDARGPLEIEPTTTIQSLSQFVSGVHLRRAVGPRLHETERFVVIVVVVINHPGAHATLLVGELHAVDLRYRLVPLFDVGSVVYFPISGQIGRGTSSRPRVAFQLKMSPLVESTRNVSCSGSVGCLTMLLTVQVWVEPGTPNCSR